MLRQNKTKKTQIGNTYFSIKTFKKFPAWENRKSTSNVKKEGVGENGVGGSRGMKDEVWFRKRKQSANGRETICLFIFKGSIYRGRKGGRN